MGILLGQLASFLHIKLLRARIGKLPMDDRSTAIADLAPLLRKDSVAGRNRVGHVQASDIYG